MLKWLRVFIWVFLAIYFVIGISVSKFHRLRAEAELPEPVRRELIQLAAKSLDHSDVPVAAIVTYDDNIIGQGYNTVMRDSLITSHAEINALNEVIRSVGYSQFMKLDRDKLMLYSTYEPCEMCMGTLEHYSIKKVVYMKEKSLLHWWRRSIKASYYQLMKRKSAGSQVQDSLFHLHPDYPRKQP